MLLGYALGIVSTTGLALVFSFFVNNFGGKISSQRDARSSNDWVLFSWLFVLPIAATGICLVLLGALLSRTAKKPKSLSSLVHVYESQRSSLSYTELFASFAANAACLTSGVSLGRFGSCILLGSMVGVLLGHRLSYGSDEVLALSLCTSVAFACTCVGTPMAALCFATESSKDYSSRRVPWLLAFACVGLAAGRLFHVGMHIPRLGEESQWQFFSNLVDVGLAVCIGATGLLVSWLFDLSFAAAMTCRQYVHSKLNINIFNLTPLAGAPLILIIYALCPSIAGTSNGIVKQSVWGMIAAKQELVYMLVCKVIATTVSLAFGYHGGVVGPCLVVGCLLGNLWLTLAIEWGYDVQVDAHVVASAGTASVIAAVVKMPLFAVVFSCEMFDSFRGCAFVIVSAAVAYSWSSITVPSIDATPTSSLIPEASLRKQAQIPSSHFSHDYTAVTCAGTALDQVRALLQTSPPRDIVLVDAHGGLVGCVDNSSAALSHAGWRSVTDIPLVHVASIDVSAHVDEAVRLLARQAAPFLVVCAGSRVLALLRSTQLLVHEHAVEQRPSPFQTL